MAKDRSDYFVWQEGDVKLVPCLTCKRKHKTGPTCDAFPSAIADPILNGSNRHREPVPGDGGMVYVSMFD